MHNDGALVAVPAKDTIKTVRDGIVIDTPPRETLWQAQTPQSFRFATIYDAHRAAEQEGFMGTDDASLVERRGGARQDCARRLPEYQDHHTRRPCPGRGISGR